METKPATHESFVRIPMSHDADDVPCVPLTVNCSNCGSESSLEKSSAIEYKLESGAEMWRVRVKYKCSSCGNRDIFRLGGATLL